MLQYRAIVQNDTNGTVFVSFPDVPEAHTFGDDQDEALTRAVDALETALSMYIDDRQTVPTPSRRRGAKYVALPALTEAKIALYTAMRAARVGKAELARRLNVHMPQVDRLLDLSHSWTQLRLLRRFWIAGVGWIVSGPSIM